VRKNIVLEGAIYKLEWSTSGEWSASLKPNECRALLLELRRPPSKRTVNRKGNV
jgi:hypothetical protein